MSNFQFTRFPVRLLWIMTFFCIIIGLFSVYNSYSVIKLQQKMHAVHMYIAYSDTLVPLILEAKKFVDTQDFSVLQSEVARHAEMLVHLRRGAYKQLLPFRNYWSPRYYTVYIDTPYKQRRLNATGQKGIYP